MPLDSTRTCCFRSVRIADDATEYRAIPDAADKDLATWRRSSTDWATVSGSGETRRCRRVAVATGVRVARRGRRGGGRVRDWRRRTNIGSTSTSVAKGSKTTGISIENTSRLKFVVESTGRPVTKRDTGLTRFATNVVKAAEGSTQQANAFPRLGITHEQLEAGEHDLNRCWNRGGSVPRTEGTRAARRRHATCSARAARSW